MKTAKLFPADSIQARTIEKRGASWLRVRLDMVRSWADDIRIPKEAVEAAIAEDLEAVRDVPAEPPGIIPATESFGLVIPCHNYERFLPQLFESLKRSTVPVSQIVVVDDSSDPPVKPETVVAMATTAQPALLIRGEWRDQAKACAAGFEHITTKFCAFLDSDDMISETYLEDAARVFATDANTACVFPVLQAFGDASGPWHGTDRAPEVLTAQDIESRNWCGAGSVYRSEIVRQSLTMTRDRVKGCRCNDWRTVRDVLRSGPWNARRNPSPLLYRIHAGQMSKDLGTYASQADLESEVVSIVVLFSGRWKQWSNLRRWLLVQDWPREQTRLVIMNGSHKSLTVDDLGLGDQFFRSVHVERLDIGAPGLADINRVGRHDIGRRVEAAVCGGYNYALPFVFGEWFLALEDDVIPEQPDTIRRLFRHVWPDVAAVSGLYRHRYEGSAVAFGPPVGSLPMIPMEGTETEQVTGTGFGCLLARKSVFVRRGLSGDSVRKFYDVDIGVRVARDGWRWILDRGVPCDHQFENR